MNWAPLLEDTLRQEIPLTRALGVEVLEASRSRVRLGAPLEANLNHKHTAFGGSLYALAVLSAWSLCWLRLKEAKAKAQVVIASSREDFIAPAKAGLEASCEKNNGEFETALRTLERKGRARIQLEASVTSQGITCVKFVGSFAWLTPNLQKRHS